MLARLGLGDKGILGPGAFRILLALAVVASHLSRLEIGRLAVLLFFFLSGYWVTRIWKSKFDSRDYPRFYASRYLRVAPLYLVAMVVAAMVGGYAIHPENLTLFGLASSHFDPLGISWSLDIELQFYVLAPLIAWLVVSQPDWRIGLIALTLALAVLGWAVLKPLGIVTVAQFLPAFLLGVMTNTYRWDPGRRAALASLGGFILITGLLALLPMTRPFLDKTAHHPFDRDIFGFFWMLPLLPYVAHSLTLKSGRLDRHLGNLSFPIYLAHYPVIDFMTRHYGFGFKIKLAAVLIALALALLLYVLVDRPVDALRVRWTEQPRRRVAAQEPATARGS